MAVSDALDVEAAVDEIVRAALRAVAKAADDDQLPPESHAAVTGVLMHLISEAAAPIPTRVRIPALVRAQELLDAFVGACANETA